MSVKSTSALRELHSRQRPPSACGNVNLFKCSLSTCNADRQGLMISLLYMWKFCWLNPVRGNPVKSLIKFDASDLLDTVASGGTGDSKLLWNLGDSMKNEKIQAKLQSRLTKPPRSSADHQADV